MIDTLDDNINDRYCQWNHEGDEVLIVIFNLLSWQQVYYTERSS